MRRRKWNAHTKTKVLLEGLAGRPVSEICNEYKISEARYQQWREQFVTDLARPSQPDGMERSEVFRRLKNAAFKRLSGGLGPRLKGRHGPRVASAPFPGAGERQRGADRRHGKDRRLS